MIHLGSRSLTQLATVAPDLQRVVRAAADLSSQDFGVYEGVRSLARQKQLLAQGATKTLHSKHLPHPDGFGHAVDLVAWIGTASDPRRVTPAGAWSWDWKYVWPIAAAMQRASNDLGVPITWGAVWDRLISELPQGEAGLKAAVERYKARHPGSDFLDGPHFQLGRN